MTAPAVAAFPVDDTTLDLLWTAIRPGPESERSSLNDFLDLLSDMHFGPATGREEAGVTVLGAPRWSDGDVIAALIGEVRRLRGGAW